MLEKQAENFNVGYLDGAKARSKPNENILEERWLHEVFLWTHVPISWRPWQLGLAVLVLTVVVWLTALPFGPLAFTVAAVYLGFTLVDWALLSWLPESRRSFGPVAPQLLLMTAPRIGVTMFTATLAFFLPDYLFPLLWLTVVLQAAGTLSYGWGMLYEPFALTTTEITIETEVWSGNALPLRILHLSDFHIERLTRRELHVPLLIDRLNPDMIVITGDYLNLSYVDEPVARAEVRRLLEQLHAPFGVYATLGSPPVDRRETTPTLFEGLTHIRLLRDEVAVMQLPDGRNLSLLGLDCSHDLTSDASALERLVALAPDDAPRVLLYHSPELMPAARDYPIDLYLCGHTHGGQIRIPLYGAILTSSVLGKRYEMGRYDEKGTTLYISRGIGLEGLSAPRMRLFCPPELVLVTLSGKGA